MSRSEYTPPPEVSNDGNVLEPFPLIPVGEIQPRLDTLDFIENLLTKGGMSVVYGPSNVGKSFWILDLAAHVASGKDWRFGEHQIEAGAVIYFALEGAFSVWNRISAMKTMGLLNDDTPFFLVEVGYSLLEPDHTRRLVETIAALRREKKVIVKLVVIDTFSRALAAGNENASDDMSAAIAAVDEVRAKTEAHVCLVHHCGKDQARGARGHSALRAAVDTEIELFRPANELITTVQVTKQRDLEFCGPMPFSLQPVTLGENDRGKPITSCIVEQMDGCLASERGKPGRKKEIPDAELLALLPQPTKAAWLKEATERLGISRSTFYERVRELESSGKVLEDGSLKRA
jgi:hypothetical protein